MKGVFDRLRVGRPDRSGDKVTFVLGHTSHIAVYMIDGDYLKIDAASDSQTPRELEILQVYDRLYRFISLAFKDNKALPFEV
jgi:hypothetical protein